MAMASVVPRNPFAPVTWLSGSVQIQNTAKEEWNLTYDRSVVQPEEVRYRS